MQKKSSYRIPIGIKKLAEMMAMTESEVRFFPKLDDLREHLKNYNYGMYTKNVLVDNLKILQQRCVESKLDAYVEGVNNLISAVQYRY